MLCNYNIAMERRGGRGRKKHRNGRGERNIQGTGKNRSPDCKGVFSSVFLLLTQNPFSKHPTHWVMPKVTKQAPQLLFGLSAVKDPRLSSLDMEISAL